MSEAVILLSGGLDSLVSLDLKKDDVKFALTFDYGQKSAEKEITASKQICDYYKILHKVVKLDWLRGITTTSLVSDKQIPVNEMSQQSMKSVWVPNRNGLFLNIAATFADAQGFDNVIIGANKEEGETFPDNTQEFINAVNEEFKFSTLKKPEVIAPLINCDKNDIVMLALQRQVPLELVMSCYQDGDRHCGICESCLRLKHALEFNNAQDWINKIFG